MSDGFVQAPPDAGGKKVDSTELTVNGVTVERLRIAIPDGLIVKGELLDMILCEMRTTNSLIAQAFGLDADDSRGTESKGIS